MSRQMSAFEPSEITDVRHLMPVNLSGDEPDGLGLDSDEDDEDDEEDDIDDDEDEDDDDEESDEE